MFQKFEGARLGSKKPYGTLFTVRALVVKQKI
jgi:hypothetical protein